MTTMFDAAVVIGRFQPFHNGHLALIKEALRTAPRVFVVIGSAFAARSPRNPWTHAERSAMLLGALSSEERGRVSCVPMRDYFNEPRWRRVLTDTITRLTGPDARIAVVGHFKDSTSDYLKGFEDWGLVQVPLLGNVHATELRDAYFLNVAAPDDLRDQVPSTTHVWLEQFATGPEFHFLGDELRALQAYRREWEQAPFPPVFVTVDAVVTCRAHVLLIQRGKAPGKGLWAVPGGFLDLDETLIESAHRELKEETGLELPIVSRSPLNSHVFDHPQRSQRGRTISHGFYFELDAAQLPSLTAADDAAALAWVPQGELASRESEFFDDHFHILDTFLRLLPE